MGTTYRKRCLEYALQQCREDAIVNMTDDEIIAEWGLARGIALPERELLAEALKALTEMLRHSGVADAHAMDKFESDHDAERRARAAADKIRAALEHDKGEPKP